MPSTVQFCRRLADIIDSLNEWIGTTVSWLTLIMVVVTFTIVMLRYAFNYNSIAMQESVSYMHALVFMLGAAYTLKTGAHVRVDIFYQRLGRTARAWIDCCGVVLLLLPVSGFILYSSWDYVAESWKIFESSSNSGGLPGVFLIKTTIPLTACLLILQGISMFLANLMIALGIDRSDEPGSIETRDNG
ncbi:TRAP transporter small permease subunit [Methylotuvimicrobium alcaliphilum]|uniref:TRAP transporter small permease protein n=1 Tax=Methylotuvimicrobium alcaliphilum (strain DSM 19304 / NCIMB 14124 / VKM B-2133 / 20Z) TaxID=1091494 RepID=G4SVF6_META2|nr:TRAP transporter small permease subunit [Methylotuvimicrobium alcaliphilum]CCE22928.1 putative TRAP C4-dicarboxylate transport system, DctQ subunit [Methylotuvimicrobium alcaliphilum 20Z]